MREDRDSHGDQRRRERSNRSETHQKPPRTDVQPRSRLTIGRDGDVRSGVLQLDHDPVRHNPGVHERVFDAPARHETRLALSRLPFHNILRNRRECLCRVSPDGRTVVLWRSLKEVPKRLYIRPIDGALGWSLFGLVSRRVADSAMRARAGVRRNCERAVDVYADPVDFVGVARWHPVRFTPGCGPTVEALRTAISRTGRAVPGRARSLRNLPGRVGPCGGRGGLA